MSDVVLWLTSEDADKLSEIISEYRYYYNVCGSKLDDKTIETLDWISHAIDFQLYRD